MSTLSTEIAISIWWLSMALVGLFLILSPSASQAYFLASDTKEISSEKPTDVFIAGYGNDQGSQFLKAALLSYQISKDRFPMRQRILISAVNEDLNNEKAMLQTLGLSLLTANEAKLAPDLLPQILKRNKIKIISLQFFGHANTYNGFRVQSKTERLNPDQSAFSEFASFFLPDAFAIFHSCNSGWILAPQAARQWGIPVFGSFAAADFQALFDNNQWYYNDSKRIPEGLQKATESSALTSQNLSCRNSQCLRLKPVNFPYEDEFGRFSRGLGFYKVFAKKDTLPKVPQSLIHLTLLLPSSQPLRLDSSREQILDAVTDWMCPTDKKGELKAACREAILTQSFRQNPEMSFYNGESVACDNLTCKTTVKCSAFKYFFGAAPCTTTDLSNEKSKVFSEQMLQIFDGLAAFERNELNIQK